MGLECFGARCLLALGYLSLPVLMASWVCGIFLSGLCRFKGVYTAPRSVKNPNGSCCGPGNSYLILFLVTVNWEIVRSGVCWWGRVVGGGLG